MQFNFTNALAELQRNGAVQVQSFTNAEGKPSRIFKDGDFIPLSVGDKIVIPRDYVIYEETIFDRPAKYIPVTRILATGEEMIYKLFPNGTLGKSLTPLSDDGDVLPQVRATGSAVDAYMAHDLVDDGVKALAGHTLIVKEVREYLCRDRWSGKKKSKHVCKIDFAD